MPPLQSTFNNRLIRALADPAYRRLAVPGLLLLAVAGGVGFFFAALR